MTSPACGAKSPSPMLVMRFLPDGRSTLARYVQEGPSAPRRRTHFQPRQEQTSIEETDDKANVDRSKEACMILILYAWVDVCCTPSSRVACITCFCCPVAPGPARTHRPGDSTPTAPSKHIMQHVSCTQEEY